MFEFLLRWQSLTCFRQKVWHYPHNLESSALSLLFTDKETNAQRIWEWPEPPTCSLAGSGSYQTLWSHLSPGRHCIQALYLRHTRQAADLLWGHSLTYSCIHLLKTPAFQALLHQALGYSDEWLRLTPTTRSPPTSGGLDAQTRHSLQSQTSYGTGAGQPGCGGKRRRNITRVECQGFLEEWPADETQVRVGGGKTGGCLAGEEDCPFQERATSLRPEDERAECQGFPWQPLVHSSQVSHSSAFQALSPWLQGPPTIASTQTYPPTSVLIQALREGRNRDRIKHARNLLEEMPVGKNVETRGGWKSHKSMMQIWLPAKEQGRGGRDGRSVLDNPTETLAGLSGSPGAKVAHERSPKSLGRALPHYPCPAPPSAGVGQGQSGQCLCWILESSCGNRWAVMLPEARYLRRVFSMATTFP